MTGYGDFTTTPVKVLADFTDVELTNYIKTLVDEYTLFTRRDHTCGYAWRRGQGRARGPRGGEGEGRREVAWARGKGKGKHMPYQRAKTYAWSLVAHRETQKIQLRLLGPRQLRPVSVRVCPYARARCGSETNKSACVFGVGVCSAGYPSSSVFEPVTNVEYVGVDVAYVGRAKSQADSPSVHVVWNTGSTAPATTSTWSTGRRPSSSSTSPSPTPWRRPTAPRRLFFFFSFLRVVGLRCSPTCLRRRRPSVSALRVPPPLMFFCGDPSVCFPSVCSPKQGPVPVPVPVQGRVRGQGRAGRAGRGAVRSL